MSVANVYLARAATWLGKQGLAVDEMLGEGTYSQVWSLEGRNSAGIALKISTDDQEWLAMPLVKAAQDAGKAQALVRIHKFEQASRGAVFALVEKLEPLSKDDKKAFAQCEPYTHLPGPWRAKAEVVYDPTYWWGGLDGRKYQGGYRDQPMSPFVWTSAVQINANAINQSLVEAGIKKYSDWHGGNIMRRPGYGVVVCDLGRVST